MKLVTSQNTSNDETSSAVKRRAPIDLDIFIKAMEVKGYKQLSPWDDGGNCLKIGGSTYPTFISQDGKVKVAFERNSLFFHNNDVWFGDSSGRPNVVILAGIVTDQESRGQGLASKALNDFKSSATESGFEVQLQPTPMKSFTQKKKPFLNDKQLKEWYKRHGFFKKYPNSEAILTTNDVPEKITEES